MNGDSSVVGQVGHLVHATRGVDGPGEVRVRIRGGTEFYLAWSVEPLPSGAVVLVVEERDVRTVDVVPWADLPDSH